MRDDGNESAGMLDAMKLSAGGYRPGQAVTVAADGTWVRLDMSASSYPAGLTPAQARFIARKLYRMARLAEQRGSTP